MERVWNIAEQLFQTWTAFLQTYCGEKQGEDEPPPAVRWQSVETGTVVLGEMRGRAGNVVPCWLLVAFQ